MDISDLDIRNDEQPKDLRPTSGSSTKTIVDVDDQVGEGLDEGLSKSIELLPEIVPTSEVEISIFKDITIESVDEVDRAQIKARNQILSRTASQEALLNPSKSNRTSLISEEFESLSLTADGHRIRRSIKHSELVPVKDQCDQIGLNSPYLREDLIPPTDPCYRDLGLRDESVKLLHLITCLEIYNFINSIIDETRVALSINQTASTTEESHDGDNSLLKPDYESINHKLKSIVMSCVRRNVDDLCKNSRIQTQLMIGELLLSSRSSNTNENNLEEREYQSEISKEVKGSIKIKIKELINDAINKGGRERPVDLKGSDTNGVVAGDEGGAKESDDGQRFEKELLDSISTFGNINWNSIPISLFSTKL
ncbi:expressed protein [Phakopsora pachyrhizi]|uniref:Expressed protein n=1 Tax=Phakopsora pachyrhizi TaxID=170000 RepID=A0AAV0B8Y4_PHAPC|nr:expressed protein [Phakopsora pachyrhizi]